MKNLSLLVILPLALIALSTNLAAESGELFVSVRSTPLRSQPQFLSSTLETLSYGQRLSSIEEQGAWIKVRSTQGKIGYIHNSASTTRKIILNPEAQFSGSSASEEDIVLAGKGFSKNVEKAYARSRGVNYGDVDAMEKREYSDKALAAFVSEGRLAQ